MTTNTNLLRDFQRESSQKRLLFFVHDGTGLGHLRRMSRIAKALQGPCACLIVSGHRAMYWFVPEECEYIHIPSLDNLSSLRSQHWGRDPFVEMELGEIFQFRHSILKGIIEGFKPDAIFVDYLPLGKNEELADFIKETPAKKYYITRGIINQTSSMQDIEHILFGKAKEYLELYYDKIFLACDKKILNFEKKYMLSQGIKNKLSYVGYVSEKIDYQEIQSARLSRGIQPNDVWVVCSAGGGQLGEKLIMECIRLSSKFNGVYFDIVMGPRSNLLWDNSLLYQDVTKFLRLHKETHHLPLLHAASNIVVTTGGYNSLLETLQGNAEIICCPARLDPNDEQYQHACLLSRYAPIKVIAEPKDLERTLKSTLQDKHNILNSHSNRSLELNLNGANNIRKIVCRDFGLESMRREG